MTDRKVYTNSCFRRSYLWGHHTVYNGKSIVRFTTVLFSLELNTNTQVYKVSNKQNRDSMVKLLLCFQRLVSNDGIEMNITYGAELEIESETNI